MIILLSPSKGQDFSNVKTQSHSQPAMLEKSKQLIAILQQFDSSEVQQLMSISANLAELNVNRFQSFCTPFDLNNAKPAALAFQGDVYTGLDFASLTTSQIEFAQKHLRIVSGLYGYLRPLDLIQAYRLEMKTKLENPNGNNLYQFWGNTISDAINAESGDCVINLASNEYFKAVQAKRLNGQVLNLHFKEQKQDKIRVIAFYAKKARGSMARAIIERNINQAQQIKDICIDNYRYNQELSTAQDWVFVRPQPEKS